MKVQPNGRDQRSNQRYECHLGIPRLPEHFNQWCWFRTVLYLNENKKDIKLAVPEGRNVYRSFPVQPQAPAGRNVF